MKFDDFWRRLRPNCVVYCEHSFPNKGIVEVRPFLCLNYPHAEGAIVMAIISKQCADYYPYQQNQVVFLPAGTAGLGKNSVAEGFEVVAKEMPSLVKLYHEDIFNSRFHSIPGPQYKELLDFVLKAVQVKEKHRKIIFISNDIDYFPL